MSLRVAYIEAISRQTINEKKYRYIPVCAAGPTIGPFEWLFSSSTFFRQKSQRSEVIQQTKFDGVFFRLVSSTTRKNQTGNQVG